MESLQQMLFGNWIVLIVLISAVFLLLASVVDEVRKYACHWNELQFKRELVERGLPVDEIERIVAAKSKRGRSA